MNVRSRVLQPLSFLAILTFAGAVFGHSSAIGDETASEELSEDAPIENVRFFKEVHDARYPGTYQALSRLGYNGDFVLLIETDAARKPISDTLLVWVQHHGPDKPLAKQAAWADLIIACYPELLPGAERAHHVLPNAKGKIWLYFIKDRYVVITDQRHAALDFALKEP